MTLDVLLDVLNLCATGAGAAGILLGVCQLRFDAWLKAQELWTARDFVSARGLVFARLDSPASEWSREDEATGLDLCRRLDEFASLVPYLSRSSALRYWGVPFAKSWVVLEPLVQKERAKCSWDGKWQCFQVLAQDALKRHPEIRAQGK